MSEKCAFEHIYFAHPASSLYGRNVYTTRIELGKMLAQNDDTAADIVIPVEESGTVAAIGYSQASGIPFHTGLIKNHWVGRSFTQPTQEERENTVREKFALVRPIIEGKKIIVVDDSIVRGTTSREIVAILKAAGAKEIHFRLSSPMILGTCEFRDDMAATDELIAIKYKGENAIAAAIGADSVKFLSLLELKEVFGADWCYNCFGRPQ
jgi:amidophosphoribosyltransferase